MTRTNRSAKPLCTPSAASSERPRLQRVLHRRGAGAPRQLLARAPWPPRPRRTSSSHLTRRTSTMTRRSPAGSRRFCAVSQRRRARASASARAGRCCEGARAHRVTQEWPRDCSAYFNEYEVTSWYEDSTRKNRPPRFPIANSTVYSERGHSCLLKSRAYSPRQAPPAKQHRRSQPEKSKTIRRHALRRPTPRRRNLRRG